MALALHEAKPDSITSMNLQEFCVPKTTGESYEKVHFGEVCLTLTVPAPTILSMFLTCCSLEEVMVGMLLITSFETSAATRVCFRGKLLYWLLLVNSWQPLSHTYCAQETTLGG